MPVSPLPQHFIAPATSNSQASEGFVVDKHLIPLEGGSASGYGDVTWRTLISADRTMSSDLLLGVAEFPPHGTLLPHRHTPPEFYFCLSGSGVVTIDGVAHQVFTGSAVFIPGNAEHGVEAGPDGLSFAYGFACHSFIEIEYVFSDRANVVPFALGEQPETGFDVASGTAFVTGFD